MKTSAIWKSFFLICNLIPCLLVAQTKDVFDEMKQAVSLRGASWSACIWKVGDKEPLYVKDEYLSLATGSVMKVLTTATALEILGKDYAFETSVVYSGQIIEGVLKGDLWIIGGGDPDLGYPSWYPIFDQWHAAIDALGIKKITGAVKVYTGYFESQMVANTAVWEDIGNYFGAGVSGLNFHRNEYRLVFEPQEEGLLAKVLRTEPTIKGITFVNEMKTGSIGSGDQGYIYGAPYSDIRYLRGSVPAGVAAFSIKGSMPNPALTCVTLFEEYLKGKGLIIDEKYVLESGKPKNTTLIIKTYSRPISAMIKETNGKSINIQADALFKEMAHYSSTSVGSFKGAEKAVIEYWESQGLDFDHVHLEDGSGLSRYNAISSKQLSQVLMKMYTGAQKDVFYKSLAVAGTSGTLKYFGRDSNVAGHFYGKSGYIKRVRGIAGYLSTDSSVYVVVVLVNNFEGRTKSVDQEIVKVLDAVMKQ